MNIYKKLSKTYINILNKYHIDIEDKELSSKELYELCDMILVIYNALQYSEDEEVRFDLVVLTSLIDILDDYEFDNE